MSQIRGGSWNFKDELVQHPQPHSQANGKPRPESNWIEALYVELSPTTLPCPLCPTLFQTNLVPMNNSELQEVLEIHSNL